MCMSRIVSSVFKLFWFYNVPNWLVPHILLEKLNKYPKSTDLGTIFRNFLWKKKKKNFFLITFYIFQKIGIKTFLKFSTTKHPKEDLFWNRTALCYGLGLCNQLDY